jgi:flavodoxin
MKSITSMTHMMFAFFLLISACSSSQVKDPGAQTGEITSADKILIVYLSRTNNTRAIAEIINKNAGGTLVALEPEKPYPKDYRATVEQVANENASGFLPPLRTRIDSMENYDVVFVGFPTWGMQLPPPMKSFLKQYDLGGKTIVPFNTNGGYGVGSSFQTIKELCPGSTIVEGFEIKGGVERDGEYLIIKDEKRKEAETKVKAWLKKIKSIKTISNS